MNNFSAKIATKALDSNRSEADAYTFSTDENLRSISIA